ncbi:uncharacterized protein LOC126678855 isoform X2 [Mercurialis annua]|uniref:uncharacterized protein LOC126678855 isoform X2 n=1 Tax=Mercurialis annua TaxID=3986 RepID=UPI00215F24E5|nr:uncharacterized protein LOC126678855 isoform X2 [Mercurialis annua]
MVHTRFITSLLGLLFVLNTLKDYSYYAHAHQDSEREKHKLLMDEDSVITAHKGLFLDGLAAERARKFVFGGRKMVVEHEVMMRRKIGEKDEISVAGYEKNALMKRSFHQNFNPQEKMNNRNNLGGSRSEEEVKFSDTNPNKFRATTPKSDTQRLVEATREIVNLMNKDYKGTDRPRRKPPINNHIPIH